MRCCVGKTPVERKPREPVTRRPPFMDRGCTFSAKRSAKQSLALEELPAPPASISSIEEAKPVPTRAKTGRKIVVIDDTEMLLIFVEDSLALADPNLQIVTAFTGEEGVRRVETMMPDLVLLDYSLQGLARRPDLRTSSPKRSHRANSSGHDVRPRPGNDGHGRTLPKRRCDDCQALYVGSAGATGPRNAGPRTLAVCSPGKGSACLDGG